MRIFLVFYFYKWMLDIHLMYLFDIYLDPRSGIYFTIYFIFWINGWYIHIHLHSNI